MAARTRTWSMMVQTLCPLARATVPRSPSRRTAVTPKGNPSRRRSGRQPLPRPRCVHEHPDPHHTESARASPIPDPRSSARARLPTHQTRGTGVVVAQGTGSLYPQGTSLLVIRPATRVSTIEIHGGTRRSASSVPLPSPDPGPITPPSSRAHRVTHPVEGSRRIRRSTESTDASQGSTAVP